MVSGTILRFKCQTSSLFHISRQEYANLVKCAPFITGSAIRGTLLKHLIETVCPEEKITELNSRNDPAQIADFHCQCTVACPVKPFFDNPALARFSFGKFREENYRRTIRIAIERANKSVAEGSIVNIEAIDSGSEFTFEVLLLGDATTAVDTVRSGVEQMAKLNSLGHLRSVGFGRFKVLDVEEEDIGSYINNKILSFPSLNGKTTLVFVTPFVLDKTMVPYTLTNEAFRLTLIHI